MNMTYKSDDGILYTLISPPIASGGEGCIYEIENYPDIVAKIYHEDKCTESRHEKIKAMILTSSSKLPECAWPKAMLYKNDQFCGYIMDKKTGYSNLAEFYSPKGHESNVWSKFIIVAANISAAVYNIHECGHIIGDLNPNNILVDVNSCKIVIVDTDSFHIRKNGLIIPCMVVTPEYIPKELQGKDFNKSESWRLFNESTDNFALAIIIFRLLMNGVHPFACTAVNISASQFQPEMNIANGYCAYFSDTNYGGNLLVTIHSPYISILPEKVQKLFARAFVADAAQRPSAYEWYDAMMCLAGSLKKCRENPMHQYYSGKSSCPWCAYEQSISARKKYIMDNIKIDEYEPKTTLKFGQTKTNLNKKTASTPNQIPKENKVTSSEVFWLALFMICLAITIFACYFGLL